MKSKTTFLLFILSIIIALGLSSCMNNKDQPIPDPYLSLEELKVGFFRNGRILFSAENQDISMFSTTDNIGIRILKKKTDDYQEDFAYLDFSAVSNDAITFKAIYYPSQATKTVSQHTLTSGESLDLNGDDIWDIKLSATDTSFSKSRSLSDAIFIELNNTPDISTTFRTISGNKERHYPIMTVNASDQICIDEKALPRFISYDPGERTIVIDTSTLNLEVTEGDMLLLGPSFNHSMGNPIKKIESVQGNGNIRTLHLREMNSSEFSQFFRGAKYKNIYGSNPDEPYLFDDRGDDFVLWSGEINHVSQGADSTIKVYSHEPIQILLAFMDIDFEMGLDNDLKRFFYHPVFAVKGNITMEVNATERNTLRTYFFSEPITFDGLDLPLSGNVRFGFSNQSEGEGRIDAHATYRFDETYYSLRIDAQDWDESSQWIPYADFRRNIEIISATGTHNPSDCAINPSLHIDSTLSFLNLFNVHQNDLRFGLKFNNYQQKGTPHLDVIPSFAITSGYDVEYMQQKKAVFPQKVIYSVELSPYSID